MRGVAIGRGKVQEITSILLLAHRIAHCADTILIGGA
jgi:hypothetical protein